MGRATTIFCSLLLDRKLCGEKFNFLKKERLPPGIAPLSGLFSRTATATVTFLRNRGSGRIMRESRQQGSSGLSPGQLIIPPGSGFRTGRASMEQRGESRVAAKRSFADRFLSGILRNIASKWRAIVRPFTGIASRRRALAYLDQQIARRIETPRAGELEFRRGGLATLDTAIAIAAAKKAPQIPSVRNARILSLSVIEESTS